MFNQSQSPVCAQPPDLFDVRKMTAFSIDLALWIMILAISSMIPTPIASSAAPGPVSCESMCELRRRADSLATADPLDTRRMMLDSPVNVLRTSWSRMLNLCEPSPTCHQTSHSS